MIFFKSPLCQPVGGCPVHVWRARERAVSGAGHQTAKPPQTSPEEKRCTGGHPLAGSWYCGTGIPGCWFASHLEKKTYSNQQPTAEKRPRHQNIFVFYKELSVSMGNHLHEKFKVLFFHLPFFVHLISSNALTLCSLCLWAQLWTDFNSCLTSLGKVVDLSDCDDLRQLVA